jgi:hypothetical protein
MSRPKTKRASRLFAGAIAAPGLAAWLGGCSDIYLDHRETVGLSGGDAVAANAITQMVDPWPPNSGNNNIGFNGQKMQSAVERYRTNRVIPPIGATTSGIDAAPAAAEAPAGAGAVMQGAAAAAPATASMATTQ